jgi:hypothetical protein
MNTMQSFACANYILDEFHERNEKLNNYELNILKKARNKMLDIWKQ